MHDMVPCKFVFDDSPEFPGFSDGSTWNGWDNVWVTPETREVVVSWFRSEFPNPETEDENKQILAPPVDGGLVCLGWGYTTQIVAEDG